MLLQKRIHDWSRSLPAWQSDLLRRLAVGPLTDADRAEARAILTGQAGAPAPVPLKLTDLPVDEDEHGRVELPASETSGTSTVSLGTRPWACSPA